MATRYWNKNMPFEVETRTPQPRRRPTHYPTVSLNPKGDITEIQLRLLQFWREFTDRHGYAPTLREACKHFGWRGTNNAGEHAERLRIRGLLVQIGEPNQARAIVLTARGRAMTTRRGQPTGTVVQEKRCACGVAHFLDSEICAACRRVGT